MKSLIKVLKNEKYRTLLLFFVFVFNSALFLTVSAQVQYRANAGTSNFVTIADPEVCYLGTSCLGGIVGAGINSVNNGLVSEKGFSVLYAQCVEAEGEENCDPSYVTLSTLNKLGEPGFSAVNAVASINSDLLEQRPLSAVDYFQDKVYALTHFNVVSAQDDPETVSGREAYYSPGGTGFALLKPIQNFWSWSVRVVYGFLIIIVIIIAFAIMFRQRLSGNVEVTVQNAIPAIAMAMILVPLSYAISGLFIDFITVGTNAVHEFIIGAQGAPGYSLYENSGDNLYKDPITGEEYADRGYYPDDIRVDWLRARDKINVSKTFGAVAEDVGAASGLNGNVIFLAVGSIVNAITGQSDSDPANFTWVGDIVQFFISIVTLWIGIQVFVHLFKKYMTIILYPVISPFIFATVAVPGNGTKSIMQYVKVMMAAALAFIVTYAMFLLAILFTSQEFLNDVPTFASASFNPPLIGLKSIGIGSNEMTQLLLTLIGLGIYFSIPNTMKSIDAALGANEAIPNFIKTPIDSFRDSQRVMFKTAPATAARLTGTGLRLAGRTGAAPFRAVSGGMDLIDKARGIDPETDYRSYRNRQRAARADRAQNAKERNQAWQQSGNIFKKVAGGALTAVDNAENALAGQIEGTGTSLPSSVQRPKVTVSGNEFTISRQDLLSILTSSDLSGAGGVTLVGNTIVYPAGIAGERIVLYTGTFDFKVEGPSVTLPVNSKLTYGTVVSKSASRPESLTWNETLKPADIPGKFQGLKYKKPNGTDVRASSDEISIELGAVKNKGVDTVRQEFSVVTRDLQALLGTENGSNNASQLVPISPNAIMRSGTNFELPDALGIRINGKDEFETLPFNVKFRLS